MYCINCKNPRHVHFDLLIVKSSFSRESDLYKGNKRCDTWYTKPRREIKKSLWTYIRKWNNCSYPGHCKRQQITVFYRGPWFKASFVLKYYFLGNIFLDNLYYDIPLIKYIIVFSLLCFGYTSIEPCEEIKPHQSFYCTLQIASYKRVLSAEWFPEFNTITCLSVVVSPLWMYNLTSKLTKNLKFRDSLSGVS